MSTSLATTTPNVGRPVTWAEIAADAGRRPRTAWDVSEGFWVLVQPVADGCWVRRASFWTGGSGKLGLGPDVLEQLGLSESARYGRVAWALVFGPVAPADAIRANCRNVCVRPSHLRQVRVTHEVELSGDRWWCLSRACRYSTGSLSEAMAHAIANQGNTSSGPLPPELQLSAEQEAA